MKQASQHPNNCDFFLGETHNFPSIDDNSCIDLSVVVPAFNEEKRLPSMLKETIGVLENRRAEKSTYSYEIIIVDDGSKDETTNVALRYAKDLTTERCRVLTLGS